MDGTVATSGESALLTKLLPASANRSVCTPQVLGFLEVRVDDPTGSA